LFIIMVATDKPHVKNPYNSTFAYCSQGVQKIFTAPVYRAHCAVIFAIAQLSCLFLVDIKKLLIHSISPIIIAGGLILIYNFFAPKTERVVQYHYATPPPSPMHRLK